jgi:excisionase family DNA binding protein
MPHGNHTYYTPEEVATMLKVAPVEIMKFIEGGKLRVIRLGNSIRIRERDLERFLDSCATGGDLSDLLFEPPDSVPVMNMRAPADGTRLCLTRRGSQFRVRGSLEGDVEIWPGQMKYPVKFPADFNRAMLQFFGGKIVDVGGSFSGPTPGSLGEYIKQKLELTLLPAVYLAALLIDEGYAESAGRGKIRFVAEPREVAQ